MPKPRPSGMLLTTLEDNVVRSSVFSAEEEQHECPCKRRSVGLAEQFNSVRSTLGDALFVVGKGLGDAVWSGCARPLVEAATRPVLLLARPKTISPYAADYRSSDKHGTPQGSSVHQPDDNANNNQNTINIIISPEMFAAQQGNTPAAASPQHSFSPSLLPHAVAPFAVPQNPLRNDAKDSQTTSNKATHTEIIREPVFITQEKPVYIKEPVPFPVIQEKIRNKYFKVKEKEYVDVIRPTIETVYDAQSVHRPTIETVYDAEGIQRPTITTQFDANNIVRPTSEIAFDRETAVRPTTEIVFDANTVQRPTNTAKPAGLWKKFFGK